MRILGCGIILTASGRRVSRQKYDFGGESNYTKVVFFTATLARPGNRRESFPVVEISAGESSAFHAEAA